MKTIITFKSLFIVSLISMLLTGCITSSSIKRDYCRSIDTYKKGYLDVLNGKPAQSFNKEAQFCAEYEIALNQDQYNKGRTAGLKEFCTYEKGYQFGLNAKQYHNICPQEKATEFLKGYEEGDKKCLYESGYFNSLNGKPSSVFSSIKCLKLSKDKSEKEYMKGWKVGLKKFCNYKKGYEWGLNAKEYHNICPKSRVAKFLRGYRQGDKECLYKEGYSHALQGEPSSIFSYAKCLKLSKKHSNREYMKGWKAGVKVFCTYKNGYQLGLDNGQYQNICPKKLEADFFKGYTLGLQEYRAKKRQEELLAIEREKIAVEREKIREQQRALHEMQAIERKKITVEREKIREQEKTREELLRLKELGGRQLCSFNSDCGKYGKCRYDFRLKDRVCRYD